MEGNDDVEGTYHPMLMRQIFSWEATLEERKMMGAMYVQAVVDSLHKTLLDLPIIYASKLFNPKNYPSCIQVMKKFV